MTGRFGLIVLTWGAMVSCDKDPARSVRIISRPVPSATPSVSPQWHSPSIPTWSPDYCPPPPEPERGTGTLTVSGPCNFEHHGLADCTSLNDDFVLSVRRPARQGAEISIYVNVEKYAGPAKYSHVQILVSVSHLKGPFRWRSDDAIATVGKDEKSLTLDSAHLAPLLTQDAGELNLSGKLWCRPNKDNSRAASEL